MAGTELGTWRGTSTSDGPTGSGLQCVGSHFTCGPGSRFATVTAPDGTHTRCGPTTESYHIARHVGERRPYGISFALRRVALYVRTGFGGSQRLRSQTVRTQGAALHFYTISILFSHEGRKGHEGRQNPTPRRRVALHVRTGLGLVAIVAAPDGAHARCGPTGSQSRFHHVGSHFTCGP